LTTLACPWEALDDPRVDEDAERVGEGSRGGDAACEVDAGAGRPGEVVVREGDPVRDGGVLREGDSERRVVRDADTLYKGLGFGLATPGTGPLNMCLEGSEIFRFFAAGASFSSSGGCPCFLVLADFFFAGGASSSLLSSSRRLRFRLFAFAAGALSTSTSRLRFPPFVWVDLAPLPPWSHSLPAAAFLRPTRASSLWHCASRAVTADSF
jgi:hypothetical protein